MKSTDQAFAGVLILFCDDLEAALSRVFRRMLGRDLEPADRPRLVRCLLPPMCDTTTSPQAFVYDGRLILLASGIDFSLVAMGEVRWWIKEMA